MQLKSEYLDKFYSTQLGNVTRKHIEEKILKKWKSVKGNNLLGLGYLKPWLKIFESSNTFFSAITEIEDKKKEIIKITKQTCIVEDTKLPFPDLSINRILICHLLETTTQIDLLLHEMWRIMSGESKIILIVPNKLGFWCRNKNNPFGHGKSFTSFELNSLLLDHGFSDIKVDFCLFMPPSEKKYLLSESNRIERLGNKFLNIFGGIIFIEASKNIYALPKISVKILHSSKNLQATVSYRNLM